MPSVTLKPTTLETLARILPILTVVIGIAYAVSAYAFLFVPKLGRLVKGGELDLAPYAAREAEASGYVDTLKKAQASYDAVNVERRKAVQGIVPANADVQSVFVQLEALAAAAGGVLTSVEASADKASPSADGKYALRGSAQVDGMSYEQFKLFLAEVERAQRVIDIRSVILGADSAAYSLSFVAYAFDDAVTRK